MRKDFNKLLCERERPRSKDKFRNYRKQFENRNFQITSEGEILGPAQAGRKTIYGYNYKTFNENLNPLWGFIRKAAGRPWNDVYSEICKTFDKRSVINQHILDHLKYYVEQNCFMKDGKVWVKARWDFHNILADNYCNYYVHPETGILTKASQISKRAQTEQRILENNKKAQEIFRNIKGTNEQLFKIKGIWYAFKFVPIVTTKYTSKSTNSLGELVETTYAKQVPDPITCMLRKSISHDKNFNVSDLPKESFYSSWNSQKYCAISKRQISSKEKKQYGV